jgi:hypothetical protein
MSSSPSPRFWNPILLRKSALALTEPSDGSDLSDLLLGEGFAAFLVDDELGVEWALLNAGLTAGPLSALSLLLANPSWEFRSVSAFIIRVRSVDVRVCLILSVFLGYFWNKAKYADRPSSRALTEASSRPSFTASATTSASFSDISHLARISFR